MTEKNEIIVVKVNKIVPNPNNPRQIKDEKFRKLVTSIQEFPEMLKIRPIVVNKDYIVLGGNMRLKAVIEAGLKEVPIIIAENLTPEQEKEFIIKDNVGFGEWDFDQLANQWDVEELNKWGLDLPNFDESFAEDGINEDNAINANNEVTITLSMPFYHYESAEKDINELLGRHPNIICKIQN